MQKIIKNVGCPKYRKICGKEWRENESGITRLGSDDLIVIK